MNSYNRNYQNFDELRRLAEGLVKERGANDPQSRMNMFELIEELRIHQAELEIQNQELRDAQEEISRLHTEYEDLYEFAPCGYLVVGSKGKIIRCNLTGTTLLGVQRGLLFSRNFSNFLARESQDEYFIALRQAEKTGAVKDRDLKLHRDDGSFLWVRADIQADQTTDGRTSGWRLSLVDITERKRAHETLQASLEEKEMLLREVHHRVRNNLAIISALLNLQRRAVQDPASAAVLSDLETRIRSIVQVHERLYHNGNLARIDFQDYLDNLLPNLLFSIGTGRDIRCSALAHGISLGIDLAIPCGLIINELVTNAIKYAFPGGKAQDGITSPEIRVEVQKDGDAYRIVVSDNGTGLPEEIDLHTSPSFGLGLVRMIGLHQLRGQFKLERHPGTRITFTFKPRN